MVVVGNYQFLITEDNFPNSLNYQFRTDSNVLYSAYFMKNTFLNEYPDMELSNAYEFGLVEVEEKEKHQTRKLDAKIRPTVIHILTDFLSRLGKEFCLTIQYSDENEQENMRYNVFNRWYKLSKDNYPLEKHDVIFEIEGREIYKSLIIHEHNPLKEKILKEFFESF